MTQQPAGEQETTLATETATAMVKGSALPSRDLVTTALVLTAEAVAALIADDANGGNGNVAIVKSIFLRRGVG